MAAVHTNGRDYQSHITQEGARDRWDFSTPVDTLTGSSGTYPHDAQYPRRTLNFDPPAQPTNGNIHNSRSIKTPDNTILNKQPVSVNSSYLSPYKQTSRPGLDESRDGSEADSLIDLYGHRRSTGERSMEGSIPKAEGFTTQDGNCLDDEDPEHSRWIHRDKLAIIESHEMQEAGIHLPPQPARSLSKSKGIRARHIDQEIPEIPMQEVDSSAPKGKKPRTRSPILREGSEEEETLGNNFDIRNPEEIAEEANITSSPTLVYRQPDLRKSSSRIPLPKSSPMPIPQEHLERDTPLARKRGASGTWAGDENNFAYNRIRSRGNSVGSQILLDECNTPNNQHTPTSISRPGSSGSPTKVRQPGPTKPSQIRPINGSISTLDIALKARSASNNASPRTPSSNMRPKSRSGLEPRPANAINRPEGDAPWLATMYKPDPRLPPDQQLLPTHAKRLQQEQYDRMHKDTEQKRLADKASPQLPREFSPLAEHTVNGLKPSSREADEKKMKEQQRNTEWPLAPATSGSKERDQRLLGNSTIAEAGHAGYSTVPKVKENSPMKSPRIMDPFERERWERDHEKGGGQKQEKEKTCGCCIVM